MAAEKIAVAALAILLLLQLMHPASSDSAKKECSAKEIEITQSAWESTYGHMRALKIFNHCKYPICHVHVDCGDWLASPELSDRDFHFVEPGDCEVTFGIEGGRSVAFTYVTITKEQKFPMTLKNFTTACDDYAI